MRRSWTRCASDALSVRLAAWITATRSRRSLARYVALRRTPETMNKLYEQYAETDAGGRAASGGASTWWRTAGPSSR